MEGASLEATEATCAQGVFTAWTAGEPLSRRGGPRADRLRGGKVLGPGSQPNPRLLGAGVEHRGRERLTHLAAFEDDAGQFGPRALQLEIDTRDHLAVIDLGLDASSTLAAAVLNGHCELDDVAHAAGQVDEPQTSRPRCPSWCTGGHLGSAAVLDAGAEDWRLRPAGRPRPGHARLLKRSDAAGIRRPTVPPS